MDRKIIIAIDGFSSTGKSTIAKQLAKELSYVYIDTGAMYRAVTLYALQQNIISENHFDTQALINSLPEINVLFKYINEKGRSTVFLNGEDVEKEIRSIKVSKLVSEVSAIPEVRRKLVAKQQAMAKEKGLVIDGRDIGTVVFPNAELKLFLTASADKRAKRRYKELLDRGDLITYKEVLENVIKRDNLDATRKDSPLKKAKDAVVFDNSHMGLKEQFERIMQMVKNRLES